MRKYLGMQHVPLEQLEDAIRSSWSLWTADPADQPSWSSINPALGQCACTALVVQDVLGGDLLLADVRHRGGSRQGFHYWNRLSSGVEVDLTAEQFVAGEVIGEPRLVERPADVTRGRLAGQYRLLSARVLEDGFRLAEPSRPVSVKGVCLDCAGRVLMCRNWRGEWELPGGRPEIGERFDRCVEREIREETGWVVQAGNVIAAYPFEVRDSKWVDIVAYGCTTVAPANPVASREHQSVALLDIADIQRDELPAGYALAVARWCKHEGSDWPNASDAARTL